MNFYSLLHTFSKTERRVFVGALSAFLLSTVFWGMAVFYTQTVPEPIEGGSYVEGLIGQPVAINPLLIQDNDTDRALVELMFASLNTLSESILESKNHKTWNISLKEGLLWSDGQELTSDDVLFTLESIQNPETRSALAASWQGVVVEKLTDLEIKITLRNPYAFFEQNIRSLKVVPAHIFEKIPPANFSLSEYMLEPVGSGPYMFERFEKARNGFIETYHLVRNPNFAGEEALIETFTMRFFPAKQEALEEFNRRNIDGLGGLNQADVEKIKIPHKINHINMPRYYAIFFNPSISTALQNKHVRSALTKATDQNKILEFALGGRALEAPGPIPIFIDGYDESIYEEDEFSLPEAQEILEEDGWQLGEDDGVFVKIVDNIEVRLAFDLIVPRVDFLIEVVEILKSDWEKIGIQLNPVILSPKDVANEVIKTRNYQMILFGNILNNNPDTFSFWHSSQRFSPGLNLSLYENENVDTLLEEIRQEFISEVRNELLGELQASIHEDQPAIFLFAPKYVYASPKSLGGIISESIVTPASRFTSAEKWFLKTARVFK